MRELFLSLKVAAMTENTALSAETQMIYTWLARLMGQIDTHCGAREKAALLKGCALAHYRAINMDEILAPYRGNLGAFVEFLSKQWGWVVTYDEAQGVIIADENKAACVCPLVKQGIAIDLTFLCSCSEGFAEKMFSEVTGRPVSARVQQSILRGAPSCVYRIELA